MRKTATATALLLAFGARADVMPPPQPQLAVAARAIVGTWESTDDTRFSRELRADGSAIDRYDGDPDGSQSGTWQLFPGNAPPPEFEGRRALIANGLYLEIRENGDMLLFGITGVSRDALQMINLDRGNTLSFTRLR